jgi:hypothetical protein
LNVGVNISQLTPLNLWLIGEEWGLFWFVHWLFQEKTVSMVGEEQQAKIVCGAKLSIFINGSEAQYLCPRKTKPRGGRKEDVPRPGEEVT